MALFPYLDCRHHFYLPVGDGHQLYVEESGNPSGLPVVVLHGGPGGGSSPLQRRFFDPQQFRIILLDQRGAGQSRPLAGTAANTTAHLVADLELVREYLGVDRWMLFGGSWGVTLALAYSAAHGDRVLGMVLRGVFLCRQQDMDWLYTDLGAARLFPREWQAVNAPVTDRTGSLIERYAAALEGEGARAFARHWCNWEAVLAGMSALPQGPGGDDELCMATQEVHYFRHGGFLQEPLLEACAGSVLPVEIVHGDRDFVCPLDQAEALHRVLPNSVLTRVAGGAHSASHPAIANALVNAVKRLRKRVME
ncbi:prolyl aminopeptidase [Alcanivorax sp. S6407]|uniref:prolyl aminopeptidase n=1 Tax=Alcanivorax sp. S6407 TaxID=2926424 RepID=UPI001FF419FC|nr:prolyl aminopeptidase [Alcanivorax sp. S6407]MCK0153604.1 prolyl aminopeptidase [Alcanivorax sp. S6407]